VAAVVQPQPIPYSVQNSNFSPLLVIPANGGQDLTDEQAEQLVRELENRLHDKPLDKTLYDLIPVTSFFRNNSSARQDADTYESEEEDDEEDDDEESEEDGSEDKE